MGYIRGEQCLPVSQIFYIIFKEFSYITVICWIQSKIQIMGEKFLEQTSFYLGQNILLRIYFCCGLLTVTFHI